MSYEKLAKHCTSNKPPLPSAIQRNILIPADETKVRNLAYRIYRRGDDCRKEKPMTENIMTIHRENPPLAHYNYFKCDLQGLRKLEAQGVKEVWYWNGFVYIPSQPSKSKSKPVMTNHPV